MLHSAVASSELPTLRQSPRLARGRALVETFLVFAVFAIQAGWPVPDVNEAHYLGKAKHFWNPDWVPHDFFFDAPHGRAHSRLFESHELFYVTAGWPLRWLSLAQWAWCGRIATWALLAWSWRRLSLAVLGVEWWAPLSAALFVALNGRFQMAGEWVVGGFEAKGLAYAIVFLALSAFVQGRYLAACVWFGAATAWHVLVGGWAALVAAAAWITSPADRPVLGQLVRFGAIGLVVALPGLLPALAVNWSQSADTVREANEIFAFQRAPHHLVPQRFATEGAVRFTLLFACWAALCAKPPLGVELRRLNSFVLWAVAVAAIGIVLSWATWHQRAAAASVLRYYWFRLADAMLPLGVAFAWLAVVVRSARERSRLVIWQLAATLAVAAVQLSMHGAEVLSADRPRADAPNKVIDPVGWREACRWAAANTPHDATFLTPRTGQTFKWYAGRGEVVTWKDAPQDAAGIVEWWRRLVDIYQRDEFAEDAWRYDSLTELSPQRLRELGAAYQAGYLLTEAQPRLTLERLYANNSYAIYRLNVGN